MSAVLAFILDHAFRWLKLLLIFFVADTLFRLVVATGWLDTLRIFTWFLLNMSLYKLIPELGITFILNMFMLLVSIKLLFMILGKKHHEEAHHSEEKK